MRTISRLLIVTGMGLTAPCVGQIKLLGYEPPVGPSVTESSMTLQEAWGDVDGDGDLDAIFRSPTALRLALNNGTGQLSMTSRIVPKHSYKDSYFGRGVRLADLDFDADLDVVSTAVYPASTTTNRLAIRFWENDGKGGFAVSSRLRVSSLSAFQNARALAVGDLDGDKDVDIVCSDYRFLWNNGSGQFTQKDLIPNRAGRWVSVILIVDANSDGRQDVFFGCQGAGSELWLNNGRGGYSRAWVSAVYWPTVASFADVNGDKRPDLIMDDTYSATVNLFLGTGGSLAVGKQVVKLPGPAYPFSLGDVDADGDVDIYVKTYTTATRNMVLINDGKAGFTDQATNLVDPPSWPVASFLVVGSELNDLDGDGDLDIGGLLKPGPGSSRYSAVVCRNRLRHLGAPGKVKLGQTLRVTMVGEHDHSMYLGLALGEVRVATPAWGTFRLDPATMVVLPGVRLRNRVPGEWKATVPNSPSLVGSVLRFQALDVPPASGGGARLTGLARTELIK